MYMHFIHVHVVHDQQLCCNSFLCRSCGPVMHPAVSKFARLHSDRDTPLPVFISSMLSPLLDNLQQ